MFRLYMFCGFICSKVPKITVITVSVVVMVGITCSIIKDSEGEELYKYLRFRSNPIICIVSMVKCIVKEFEINMFKPKTVRFMELMELI